MWSCEHCDFISYTTSEAEHHHQYHTNPQELTAKAVDEAWEKNRWGL